MRRTFTIIDVRKQNGCTTKFKAGRYQSSTPAGAAKKAFNKLCRVKNIKGIGAFSLKMAETTAGSKEKYFMYHLQRHTLDEPITYKAGDREIVVRYKTSIKSIKSMPTKCKKSNKSSGRMRKKTARKTGGANPNNHLEHFANELQEVYHQLYIDPSGLNQAGRRQLEDRRDEIYQEYRNAGQIPPPPPPAGPPVLRRLGRIYPGDPLP